MDAETLKSLCNENLFVQELPAENIKKQDPKAEKIFEIGFPMFRCDGDGIEVYVTEYIGPAGNKTYQLTDDGLSWALYCFVKAGEEGKTERLLDIARDCELDAVKYQPEEDPDDYICYEFLRKEIREDELSIALPCFAQGLLKFDYAAYLFRSGQLKVHEEVNLS